ncbi:hypothetical protein [Planotetraspora mira]|uniref:Uncharacterized protein n=1 Tax=Planotetraspora mira TaxID=58121 RepID=A0A8J3TTM5_9ACTN|nr:hypothetical protein [Planotetraspora mira]GII32308.1 hypothetical protein Pmi06nite_57500 [Planotetraspora mira]
MAAEKEDHAQDDASATEARKPQKRAKRQASPFRRWVVSPIGSTAVTSIVASLVGALVGGAATAIATQVTVRAQADSVNAQIQTERELQLRAARGQLYSQFLDKVFDVKVALADIEGCTTKAFGAPPLPVSIRSQFNVTATDEIVRCDNAVATYNSAFLAAQKYYNGLFAWGASTFTKDAGSVLTIFPGLDYCAKSEANGKANRACTIQWSDDEALIHLWYQGGLFSASKDNPPPAEEPDAREADAMHRARTALSDAYTNSGPKTGFISGLADVGIVQLRHDFCLEMAGERVDCG